MKLRDSLLLLLWFAMVGKAIAQHEIRYGEVIDSVPCQTDSSQTYALYVPSYYSSDKKWPVIFVFEPAARGPLPVRQYRDVAEELGYIIISSNNSKNGSWEVSFSAADAIFKDGSKKFSLDSTRIYTTGFSGGSRVAVTLAAINDQIAGVIGCGAGLPGVARYKPNSADQFVYVGIVGNRDMNYQEHLELEEKLDSLGIVNNRIVFAAGHQWPAPNQLREAVYWLGLQAFKRGKVTSPTFKMDTLFQLMKSRADSLLENNRLVQALDVYEQIFDDFEGLLDIKSVDERIKSTNKLKQLKKYQRRDERLNARERKYQRKIDEAFFEIRRTRLAVTNDSTVKTKDWWFNESDSLWSVAKSKNVDKSNSGHRLLNLIWAKFATFSFKHMEEKDYPMAITLNEVWIHVVPDNVWGLWSMAKLQALTGNKDAAIDYLTRAHKAGMQYKGSVRIPEFDELRQNERFIALESKLITLKK